MRKTSLKQSNWIPRFIYEKVIPFDLPKGTQFQVIRFAKSDIVEPHYHKITQEVYLILDGSGMLIINEKSHNIEKDQMYFIEPYDIHAINAESGLLIAIFKPIEAENDIYWVTE